jgi:hypothetical protein
MPKYQISQRVMESAGKKPPTPKVTIKKLEKQVVLYSFRPETQYTCSVCVFAKDKDFPDKVKKCKIFGPSTDIKPEGSCGFWMHMDPVKESTPEVPWLGVVTKTEAGYMENKEGFSCKRCEYFDAANQDCKKVDKDSKGDTPGIIHANACCNAWEADKERANMTTEQLQEFLEKASAKK